MSHEGTVTLVPVDEEVLARLKVVAVEDASAADVTPPLTEGDAWTPERVRWFEEYHRSCRAGRTEQTWAISRSGSVEGAVRLKNTEVPGVLETGIWVARVARGTGVGTAAMRLVADQARRQGAVALRADTTTSNRSAQMVMSRLGFTLFPADDEGVVHGELPLRG